MRRIMLMMLLGCAVLAPGAARADTAMDNRADAREAPWPLPWWTLDSVDATIEPGEDLSCLRDAVPVAQAIERQSVWYRVNPPTDLTLYVRAWTPGEVGGGLGIFQAGSPSPLACGVEEGSMVLRAPVQGGVAYDIQLSCTCDPTSWVFSGWQIEVGVVPSNDDLSDAKPAQRLPYEDVAFLGAGTPDEKTAACETVPVVAPVATSDLVSNDQAPNAWYRFDASSDDTLLARAYRIPSSPDINVYELRDDGNDLVTCSTVYSTNEHEWYRPYYESTLAMFEVEAGHSYLIELDDRSDYVENTYFSLSRAARTDVSVNEVRVSAPRGATGTLRTITVDLDASNGLGPNTYDVVQVCPVSGPDEACTELANDTLDWDTAGCIGDVRVKATAFVPFAVDADETNNTGQSIVHLAGSPVGAGGGSCNLRPWTALVYR